MIQIDWVPMCRSSTNPTENEPERRDASRCAKEAPAIPLPDLKNQRLQRACGAQPTHILHSRYCDPTRPKVRNSQDSKPVGGRKRSKNTWLAPFKTGRRTPRRRMRKSRDSKSLEIENWVLARVVLAGFAGGCRSRLRSPGEFCAHRLPRAASHRSCRAHLHCRPQPFGY